MVDLAIAANFVRELTGEQFPEHHPKHQPAAGRRSGAGREPSSARTTARPAGQIAQARGRRAEGSRRGSAGSSAAALRRTLSRLAQVRG
jgi:hypothetical protein